MNLPARTVSEDKTISIPVERAADHRCFRPGMVDVCRVGEGQEELYALSLRTLSVRTLAQTMAVRPDNTLLDRGKDIRFEIAEHATIELTREQTLRFAAELARALAGDGPAARPSDALPGAARRPLALTNDTGAANDPPPVESEATASRTGPVHLVTAAAAAAFRAATDPSLPRVAEAPAMDAARPAPLPSAVLPERTAAERPQADRGAGFGHRATSAIPEPAAMPTPPGEPDAERAAARMAAPRRLFGQRGVEKPAKAGAAESQPLPPGPEATGDAAGADADLQPYHYPAVGERVFGKRTALLGSVAAILIGGSIASAWYAASALLDAGERTQQVAAVSAAPAAVAPPAGPVDAMPAGATPAIEASATLPEIAAPRVALVMPRAEPAELIAVTVEATPAPSDMPRVLAAPVPVAPVLVAPEPPATLLPEAEAARVVEIAALAAVQPAAPSPEPAPAGLPEPAAGGTPAVAVAAQRSVSPSLIVRAKADTWVQVRDGKGEVLLARVLRAGEQWMPPAQAGLRMTTGNAGGTELVLNGAPLPPLGPVGQVRRDVPLDPQRL